METRAHYVLIGGFMLGGVLLAILFTLWLGSVERNYDEYDIVFRERISGLQIGANVLFNGIRVGEVTELQLDEDDPSQVVATVRVGEGTPVKTDTVAELELVGVTGLSVVQFVGGSPTTPLLKDVSNRRVPVIVAEESAIPAALNNVGDIVSNVSRILDRNNAETVGRILSDVESLTDILSDNEAGINQAINDVTVTAAIVRRNAEQLDDTVEQINAVLANVEGLLDSETRVALQELQSAAVGVDQLVADLQTIVDENRPAIDAFAQQGLGSAVGVIARAGRLVDTTESILLEVERDPTRFLLGEGRPTTAD